MAEVPPDLFFSYGIIDGCRLFIRDMVESKHLFVRFFSDGMFHGRLVVLPIWTCCTGKCPRLEELFLAHVVFGWVQRLALRC